MLFTDGTVSTIEDLMAYESSILEVAATEGIDLAVKLGLAQEEVKVDLEAFLAGRQGAGLGSIVATEPLRKWHTFQSLALVYRDAFNRQLNDRYLGKWREYQRLARWASEALLHTGLGVAGDPVPQAAKPELSSAPGALPAATYFVRVAWRNRGGGEGAPSEVAVLSTEASSLLVVKAVDPPANAASWNVYVGFSATDLTRQNGAPLEAGESWTEPASGLATGGAAPGSGQPPEWFLRPGRLLQRG